LKPKYLSESSGRDRWMVTYMDVLTIVLVFFVSNAARSLPRPPADPKPAPAAPQEFGQLRERLAQHGLEARVESRGLVISLSQMVLFHSGEDQISREALPMVDQIADVLREIPNNVILAGHADGVPIHNRHFKNNWDLSVARGLQLLELLSSRYGIPESRLSIASYGPYRPKGPNETEEGRASNRRVEIIITRIPN